MKLSNSHGGYAGKSLIERIQSLLDRQNKRVKSLAQKDSVDYALALGRAEGMAASLAILRSSNLQDEIHFSNERIGL